MSKLMLVCLLVFTLFTAHWADGQIALPAKGVYDGNIGRDKLILMADKADSALVQGRFVINRGRAVEECHPFVLDISGKVPVLQSVMYSGKIKSAKLSADGFAGRVALKNAKRRFLFWRPKVDLSFALRNEVDVVSTKRYQDEIFPNIEVKSDLLYGRAKGYWTRSPYSDDPYIVTLGKGIPKLFDDTELLDLKLDIYYPKTDLFKNRPLVMLIHGGAFYIGSKESACEKALATTLSKRGYVVASIDYRLGFRLSPSEVELSAYRAIQDANAALRYLSHNAKGLGIDPTQVYVGGTSAGAVASLNTAFMKNNERPARIIEAAKAGRVGKLEESGNKYNETFDIKAVVNLWGAVSDLGIISKDEKISVLSIHGTADEIVPFGYDYPFRAPLMLNRLILDKMYGSKPVHDRLRELGIKNKLVALPGLGHEPELIGASTLNNWMDTISVHVSRFLYEETAPVVSVPSAQLVVSERSNLKPFYFEIANGELSQISVTGGVKSNVNPADASVIWFKGAEKTELVFLAKNKFEAWARKVFPVTISE